MEKKKTEHLIFRHFPGFARFIRENHLVNFVKDIIDETREIDMPLMKQLEHLSEEQLMQISITSNKDFLTAIEENRLKERTEKSMELWKQDALVIVGRDDIIAEDITLANFVRKEVFLKYLPLYTTDPFQMLEIVKEIDIYTTYADTLGINTYVKILKEKVKHSEEQLLAAQELADMGSYVLDVETDEIEVTPNFLKIFELQDISERSCLDENIHPADRIKLKEATDKAISENGVFDLEYRYSVGGREKIIWGHGALFVRDERKILQGTVMDVTDRKHMIQRLMRSEELYKQSQAMSHIGNWVWDLRNDRMEWSDEMYRIYGLEIGTELSFELIATFHHPDDMEKIRVAMRSSMETLEPYDYYFRIIVDGQTKMLHTRGEVLADENRKAFKMIGTVQDVTEKQLLIQSLQRSEELYKQAQALAHMGNFSHNLKTNKIAWTDEMYRIYGMEPKEGEVDFQEMLEYVHPDDKARVRHEIEEAVKGKHLYHSKYRILLKDGTLKVLERRGELFFDEKGEPTTMNGTLQDITKDYLAEQELRENQSFIRKIADTTPSLIAAYNINTGKYTFINSALEKILGYPAERVFKEGVNFFLEIIHPDDLQSVMEKNSNALEEANSMVPEDGNEPIVEFKYRLRHKDGYYHWFYTYGTIFDRNEKGLVEHVLNVSVDITAQEEAERELHHKNMELQQSNASLEEYAYVASHDLKEPLRKISTFSDRLLMTESKNLSENGKLHLEKIINASKRMQEMINDLLSVSLISGNKTFEPYSLQMVLNEVIQTLEYKIEEKKALITYDELPAANIIPSQFRQLFQNLLSNSLKFASDGRPATIKITHKFRKPHEVSKHKLAMAKKYLELKITDNGIGFDNQFANKIFSIFQRLHSHNEYEGTGIGLAICKKIVENHGGKIIAEGNPGKGATFTIIIPV